MSRTVLASASSQRNLILALLLAVAGACWALLLAAAGGEPGMRMAGPTMGLGAALFLTMWIVMMAAMMFPAAAPMILTYHRIQSGKRARGDGFVSTWVFVAGYLAVWGGCGIVAYLGAVAAEAFAARTGLSEAAAARVGGGLLIVAGLYQLTPLKDRCLAKCRSPIGFVMTAWRDGASGALRMGFLHGAYCLGCCWLLFLILFPLGIMNIAATALLTVIVFAEKSLPGYRATIYATAAALAAYGTLVLAAPQVLPTFGMMPDTATGIATEMPAGSGTNPAPTPSTGMPEMNMPPPASAPGQMKMEPLRGSTSPRP